MVSAKHAGTAEDSSLPALLAVIGLPLALIGVVIYLGVKHPSGLFIASVVLDAVVVVRVAHRFVLDQAKAQPRSAEEVANRLSLIAELVGAIVILVAAVGQARGWMHGMFRDVLVGLLLFYVVGTPIWWLGGKRRLIAALKARATGDAPDTAAA